MREYMADRNTIMTKKRAAAAAYYKDVEYVVGAETKISAIFDGYVLYF